MLACVLMFLNKVASRAARVLDMDDCPPFGLIHDPKNYPIYYDPIYYPEIYYEYFISPANSVAWLKFDLKNHIRTCLSCKKIDLKGNLKLSVEWNAPFFEFQVLQRQVVQIPLSVIENSSYARCHIIQNFFLQHPNEPKPKSERLYNEAPSWLFYEDSYYRSMLIELPASAHQENMKLLNF